MQSRRKPLGSPVSENSSNTPRDGDASEWIDGERRDSDRRRQPTRPWTRLRGPLRRALGRRASDHSGYVDRYSKRDVALLLSIFVMNVGDAFFTMLWLGRGGAEANPVMDFVLDIGPGAFVIQKCIVVGIWLVILLVHKNFRFARIGLYTSLVAYAVLMIIHFTIIALDIEPPVPHDAAKPGTRFEGEPPKIAALAPARPLRRRVDRSASESPARRE